MLLLVSKRKNKHLFYAIRYLKQILCVYCNAISIYPKFYYKCIYETYWTFVEVRNSIKAEIWTISNNRTTNCQNKMKERRTVRKKNMPDEKNVQFLFYSILKGINVVLHIRNYIKIEWKFVTANENLKKPDI